MAILQIVDILYTSAGASTLEHLSFQLQPTLKRRPGGRPCRSGWSSSSSSRCCGLSGCCCCGGLGGCGGGLGVCGAGLVGCGRGLGGCGGGLGGCGGGLVGCGRGLGGCGGGLGGCGGGLNKKIKRYYHDQALIGRQQAKYNKADNISKADTIGGKIWKSRVYGLSRVLLKLLGI